MSAEAFSNQAESTRPDAPVAAGEIQEARDDTVSAEALAAAEGTRPRNGKADKSDKAEKSEKHTPMMLQYVHHQE